MREKMRGTRENIERIALRLFSRCGYDAVSVRDIAKELNITGGALYKHYSSKRDILDCILQHMEEDDAKCAGGYAVPAQSWDECPNEYMGITLNELIRFTHAQFLYWTKDEFAADFRRLITIEQYRNAEMTMLYAQYMGDGVLKYTTDIISGICADKIDYLQAENLALEFYAPVRMLMYLYDNADQKSAICNMLEAHFESFTTMFNDIIKRSEEQ